MDAKVTRPSVQIPDESIDRMIDSMKIDPITSHLDERVHGDLGIAVSIPVGEALKRSGLPGSAISMSSTWERMPRFWMQLDQGALDAIAQTGAIYGNELPIRKNYSMSIGYDGEVSLNLWRISANPKPMGFFNEEQLNRLAARGSELLVEREQAFMAKMGAQQARAFVASSEKTGLQHELGLLSVEGQRIVLPEQELSQYGKIKSLMLKAGGEYGSDRNGSFFEFEEGYDVADILQKLQAGKKLNVKKETQFFATPREEGEKALDTLGDVRGKRLLEPSAGDGALADIAKAAGAEVIVIENWEINAKKLQDKGYDVIAQDFLAVNPQEVGPVDAVLMNPPFTGRQDIRHIKHALSFLGPEGELTAIMSTQFLNSRLEECAKFRDLVELSEADTHVIEKGAFKASGTDVATVRVHIKMQNLVAGLEARQESAKDYGLTLPFVEGTSLRSSLRP